MSTKMLVTVKLDQRLMMSQQLRQAIALLQYNTLDLKQLVQQAIEKNPLLELEETEDTYTKKEPSEEQDQDVYSQYSANTVKYHSANYLQEEESALENYAVPKSLRNFLLEQTLLCRFDVARQQIAEAIIDAIDERGCLTMTLADIQQTLMIEPRPEMSIMEEVLKTVQTFEPIGVGASNVRECLLIQLDNMANKNQVWQIARDLVDKSFEFVTLKDNKKLVQSLRITQQQYAEAVILIRTLNPNPGIRYSVETELSHEPELYVEKRKNIWHVSLTESILTSVKINHQYQDLIKQNKKHGSYGVLKQELEEARFLLKGLKRRNETLLAVAKCIVEAQKDFLENGPTHMKPMNIADVAQALNMHESTISRVTTEKYIATPRGVFELKYFFPSCISTQKGAARSATAVKAMIKNMIAQEPSDHALSDTDIAEKLKEQGINIARRTVAKYREAMHILPSYQRQSKSDFMGMLDKEGQIQDA